MDVLKKLIVGYDLCEDFTQICCYSYKTMEPIPISAQEAEEKYLIPTVLCLNNETKQWLSGEEAVTCAAQGAGVLVNHLLEKALSEEEVDIQGEGFDGTALLEKYFRRTLTMIKKYFPAEPITQLVVTVRDAKPLLVEKIYAALSLLGLEKNRVVVMSHCAVYLYYALSQDKSLWMNDVGLFDFGEYGLNYYQIHINRRFDPMVAELTKTDYSDLLDYQMLRELINQHGDGTTDKDPAYIFENIANKALYKQIITTLYLTGNGFLGGWADHTMKSLCVGRRVFFGQNLYTKGACYAAKELSGDRNLEDFLLLSDDMITNTIAVRVYSNTAFEDLPLTQAGDNWYEVDSSIEVIAQGDAELEIILKNLMTPDITRDKLQLNVFPKRPDRMTRLRINLTFKDRNSGIIKVTDLGFGDIYSGSGQVMEFVIG